MLHRALALTLLLPALAAAQTVPAEPPPGPAPSPSPSPTLPPAPKVTFSGQLRVRPEHRSPFAANGTNDLAVLQRTRLGVGIQLTRVSGLIEVQDARTWGTEASTTSNDRNVDLHQAYIRVPDLAGKRLAATLGRQELAYGDERLVGALDWATTARSFDAAVARWSGTGWSVDAFGALVNDRRTAGRGTGDQAFSGLYARLLRGRKDVELDLYALALTDGLQAQGEVPGTDDQLVGTFGARFRRAPATRAQVGIEAALQRGHRGPDGHEAFAVAAWAAWAFSGRYKPLLRLEVDYATGDEDPRDGTSGEFVNLFPTNHPYYGYADLLGWRNMRALRLTASIAPRKGQVLSADLHDFRLAEARGAWKDAGGEVLGHDPTGRAGTDLGRELDVLWRFPVREELALLGGVSVFWPGDFAKAVRTSRTYRFAYVQVLLRF